MGDDDPAYWRSLLIAERSVARREIALALALLASIVVVAIVGMLSTSDVGLFIATFYIPVALAIATLRLLPNALGRHARASYKLRQLHARDTGLPAARIVDKER